MKNVTRALKAMYLTAVPLALAAAAFPALAQISAVQVRDEPLHRLMMETGKYRVYDVVVDRRDAMLFHEHKFDNATVFLSESQITNEFANAQTADFQVKVGLVSFASASSSKSYVHRVLLRGGEPFRNITIEFLQPLSSASQPSLDPVDPALVALRDSPRGRAFRVNLEPEQSVTLPSNASDFFVVCLSEGRLAQGRGGAGLSCAFGGFHLLEQAVGVSLRNEGSRRVDFALIAIQ